MYLCEVKKGFFYLGITYSKGETLIFDGDDLEVVKKRFPGCIKVVKKIDRPKILIKA